MLRSFCRYSMGLLQLSNQYDNDMEYIETLQVCLKYEDVNCECIRESSCLEMKLIKYNNSS